MKKYKNDKNIVLDWDPNYTKLTKREREILDKAEKEYGNGDMLKILKRFGINNGCISIKKYRDRVKYGNISDTLEQCHFI